MEPFTAWLVLWAKTQTLGWLARHWPKLLVGALVLGGACVFVGVTAATVVSSGGREAAAAETCTQLGYSVDDAAYQPPPLDQAPTIPTGGAVPGFGPTDGDKITNAQGIIVAGVEAGVGRRGLIVGIAAALQESGLENLDHGDRDSLGLFQQRPSQGWGTAQQIRDPRFAALSFFGGRTSPHFDPASGKASPAGLLDVAGWAQLPITVSAQSVQRSAFPGAYAKHEARATIIVDALTGGSGAARSVASQEPSTALQVGGEPQGVMTAADYRASGVDIDAFCSSNFELASASGAAAASQERIIPSGQWTAPLQARITSPFGMRFHPILHVWRLHAGTDFQAAVGTPIAAPTVGVVETVSWDSGAGLNVTLAHAGGVETRHLHLSQVLVKPGDQVRGGQIIALSGDTGVSTGPHYHFEVHVNGVPVDPEPLMLQHGVNLRAWS
ncbi:M23 family metallopeptidase [Cellulomonas alba]|uniref:M23 family metallopeptidase n=1 Tax=Cellulomonas alba TaxID=3053467 RepID=A0ABT7SJT0_9CELL|nr:M23 family metallopeptidase [Cellulomonas alba]MDM7855797.1 M23 family metallopeptidase [Cellulomonas alba]